MAINYIKFAPIASGGMADVFIGMQAGDTGFSRLVAIKKIQEESNTDDTFVSMFRDEAKICQTLQHANIVQVLDFTEIENCYALVMELIQGLPFSTILKKYRAADSFLPVPVIILIISEIAKGLQYVHTRTDPATDKKLNIIHRDISPSNILISFEGEVKLTDFGIAKASNSMHHTQVGVLKGKYQYMSPEQLEGKPIDHQTDIYGLGCVLWEALAGRKMYEATSEPELLQKVMKGPPQSLVSEFNPQVDQDMEEIIIKAISAEKEYRYQTAGEMANALTKYLLDRQIQYTSLDLSEFLKEVVPDKIEEGKNQVKTALEIAKEVTGNITQHTKSGVFDQSRSIQINTSHGNAGITLPQFGGGTNVTNQGLNISINLGKEDTSVDKPTIERGVDLELKEEINDAPVAPIVPVFDRSSEFSEANNEPSMLGWSNSQRERTATKTRRIRVKRGSGFSDKFAMTFALLLLAVGAGLIAMQYVYNVDVLGEITKLSAKLKSYKP